MHNYLPNLTIPDNARNDAEDEDDEEFG